AVTRAGRSVTLRRCASCGCRTIAVVGRAVRPPRVPVVRTTKPFGPPLAEGLQPPPPASVHALMDVPGIGRARARKLARAGIVSAERLASADPGTVGRILGHMTLRAAAELTEDAAVIARVKS